MISLANCLFWKWLYLKLYFESKKKKKKRNGVQHWTFVGSIKLYKQVRLMLLGKILNEKIQFNNKAENTFF